MTNLIIMLVLAAILGFAIRYIYKAKKNGKKCIGCPDGCSCAHKGGAPSSGCGCGCSGEKTACSCHTEP